MGLCNIVKKVRELETQYHVHNWRKLIMSLAREKIKSIKFTTGSTGSVIDTESTYKMVSLYSISYTCLFTDFNTLDKLKSNPIPACNNNK